MNETIKRARNTGFLLKESTARARERLLAQPPEHILVVEDEVGIRELICREVQNPVAFSGQELCTRGIRDGSRLSGRGHKFLRRAT
jgi:hypothetical protein